MSLRRYLLAGFLTAAAVLLAGASVNYFVDTQHIYSKHGGKDADTYAKALIESPRGLIAVTPIRPIKLRLAALSDADCYVTGSSREMQIDLDTVPALSSVCRKITNLAVPRGTFEDFVAAAAAVAANPNARRLIVGVQSWGFRQNADDWWMEESQALSQARRMFDLPRVSEAPDRGLAKAVNLFNGSYLRRNLEALIDRGLRPGASFKPVAIAANGLAPADNDEIFCPSGRSAYSRVAIAKIPPPLATVGDGSYKLTASTPTVDPETLNQYRIVIDRLRGRGITTDFLLMPFHPKVWNCEKPYVCRTLKTVEDKINEFAAAERLRVIGSFDPAKLKLAASDFMDDMHLGPRAHRQVGYAGSIAADNTAEANIPCRPN